MTSRRPFLLLRISFPGRLILIQLPSGFWNKLRFYLPDPKPTLTAASAALAVRNKTSSGPIGPMGLLQSPAALGGGSNTNYGSSGWHYDNVISNNLGSSHYIYHLKFLVLIWTIPSLVLILLGCTHYLLLTSSKSSVTVQSGASYLSQDFVMFFHVSCLGSR